MHFLVIYFTDLFHGIYNQQLDPKKAKKVIVGIVWVAVTASIAYLVELAIYQETKC